jgi:hypothetical protein
MLVQKSVNDIFHVPEFNLPKLKDAVAKLNRKVAKLGLDKTRKIYATAVGFETKKENGKAIKVYEVHVSGDVLGVDGYTFLGRISHDKAAGNVVRSVPGQSIPQEFYNRCECDHCQRNRARKDTFIVQEDATGKVLQIGRGCLKDFFGHDPEKIAKIAEWFCQFAHTNSWGFDGNWSEVNTIDVAEYLGFVVRELKVEKWSSRSFVRDWNALHGTDDNFKTATADAALARLSARYNAQARYREEPLTDEEVARAEVVAIWWKAQLASKSALSEFENNTKVILENEACRWNDVGYIAAIVNLYNKEFEPKPVAPVASQYVGKIGEKITVKGTVTMVRRVDGFYGSSRVTRILTEEGNVVSYWNGNFDASKGDVVSLTGKVKEHKEFNHVKETVLNYVKKV